MNNKMKILLAAALTISTSSFAQDNTSSATFPSPREVTQESEYKPHVGIQGGISNPEGSYDTGSEIGLDIGFQPYIPYGIGVEFTQARAESKGVADSIDRTNILAKGAYNFGGSTVFIKDSYVGMGAGRSFATTGDNWVLAPLAGFDIALNRGADRSTIGVITAGALAKYNIVEGSASNALSVNGMLKYWF